MLTCSGGFLDLSQSESFSAKGIDISDAYTSCTLANVSYFEGTCTWRACAGGTSAERAYIEADICSGGAYIGAVDVYQKRMYQTYLFW